jgi:hypothetical protein
VPAGRVSYIAPRTRPYIAATASVAGVSGSPYRVPGAARGPSMADAHVPGSAIPAARTSHDTRAIAFAQSTLGARPAQSRTYPGAGAVQSSAFSRPVPASAPNTFSRPVLPQRSPAGEGRPIAPSTEIARPVSPATAPPSRTFESSPTPRSFPAGAAAPLPAMPRSYAPSPAPIAPRSYTPSPAPIAPRSYAPSPAPMAPRSFSPAPIAPRSYAPTPSVAPAPAVRPRAAPAPAVGRGFGGHR